MKADARVEGEIEEALRELAEVYRTRDLNRALACFAPDTDVVMYGTGADEKRVGLSEIRAQIERDWEQTESADLRLDWTSVSSMDRVAWAAADGSFQIRAGGDAMTIPVRITLVFENRGGRWLIVQGHFSVAAAAQDEGSSF
jgi:ketosteroid isomerase-like protein